MIRRSVGKLTDRPADLRPQWARIDPAEEDEDEGDKIVRRVEDLASLERGGGSSNQGLSPTPLWARIDSAEEDKDKGDRIVRGEGGRLLGSCLFEDTGVQHSKHHRLSQEEKVPGQAGSSLARWRLVRVDSSAKDARFACVQEGLN